ncbi:MAG: hypothetical protein MZV65_34670 [Chromatiales bacterium]|nr:hypothetical protein [Chromatiales bacterium]
MAVEPGALGGLRRFLLRRQAELVHRSAGGVECLAGVAEQQCWRLEVGVLHHLLDRLEPERADRSAARAWAAAVW